MMRLLRRRRDDLALPFALPSGFKAVDDVEAFVTRLVDERTAHLAQTSPGGETTATGTDEAAPVGEPSPPGDTIAEAAIAEALLDELAQALAQIAIPGADIHNGTPAFRAMYRRYAEAVALAGWRPPSDKVTELARHMP